MSIFLFLLTNFLWLILAYFVGSISFSMIFSKGKVLKHGSQNAGATNTLRTMGWKIGLLVFILDTSKAYWFLFLTSLIVRYSDDFSSLMVPMLGVGIIVGHIYPIYYKFKGGKGAASILGVFSYVSLLLSIIGAIIWIVALFFTRMVSLASLLGSWILAFLSFAHPYLNGWGDSMIPSATPWWITTISLFICVVLVTIAHRSNIKRIVHKNENKINFKSKKNKKTNSVQTQDPILNEPTEYTK